MTATADKKLMCVRPMPMTGIQRRNQLRLRDTVLCRCGQPTCRDIDVFRQRAV